MYTVIAGFDHTQDVPYDSLQFDGSINDPQPKAAFDVLDPTSSLSFQIGDEVIIFDENAPLQPSGALSPPAHNLLQKAVYLYQVWTTTGTLSSLVNITSATTIQITFNNNTSGGMAALQQTTLTGYIFPGQTYILSAYLTISTALVNANAILQIELFDITNHAVSFASNTVPLTGITPRQRISLTLKAGTPFFSWTPMYAVITIGATTSSSTNSGTLTWDTFQFEPMWFADVSYPTPDCNYNQWNTVRMPDDTIGRSRLFAGFIDSYDITYDGPARTWHIDVSGPGAVLENGLINATYESQYDDQILSNVLNSFSTQLSTIAPNNNYPAYIVRGKLFDSISFSDSTLREVFNQMVNESGYIFFIDPYYNPHYHPGAYLTASWRLTDGQNETIDNVTTFAYYDYTLTYDGTQRKRHVKVVGNKGVAPAQTDGYVGGGSSTTVYILTKPPVNIQSITVNGSAIICGLKGRDTNGINGIQALLDIGNQEVIFNTGPASGANVQITYTYSAPMVTEVYAQNTETLPLAPGYVLSPYDGKVNDSMLASLVTTNQRGISELTHYASPLLIIKLKCSQYTPAGSLVYFTSTPDNLVKDPLVVQTVTGRYLGGGVNQYEYQFGNYLPTFIDHIRNSNKTMNRNTTLANITNTLQTGLLLEGNINYFDTLTIH